MGLPNQLTVLRIALTPLVVYFLSRETLSFRCLALFVFFFASLTDWYDGYAARKFGRVTQWGKFLDPLADKVLVITTFCVFVSFGLVQAWMVVVIAVRDILMMVLRLYGEWKRQPVVTSLSAKWKTAGQMTAIYVILIYLVFHAHFSALGAIPTWLVWLQESAALDKMMLIVTGVTFATGVQYLFENWRLVRHFILACFRVFVPGNLVK
jgi:CDP-diacylglycerol--glycerol-3-phosphate 3-phosphatidyltransferase